MTSRVTLKAILLGLCLAVVSAGLCASTGRAQPPVTDADYEAFVKMIEGPAWWNAWKKHPGADLAWRCADDAGDRFQGDTTTPERASSRTFYEHFERLCSASIAALKSLPAREFDAAVTQLIGAALIRHHWNVGRRQLAVTPFPAAGSRFDAGPEVGAALASPFPFAQGEVAIGAMHKWRDSNRYFDVWFFGRSGGVAYAIQSDPFKPKPEEKKYLPPSYNFNAHTFEGSLWRGELNLSPLAHSQGEASLQCTTNKQIFCTFQLDNSRELAVLRRRKPDGSIESCFAGNDPKKPVCVIDPNGARARERMAPGAAKYGQDLITAGLGLSDHLLALFARPQWTAEIGALETRLRQAADEKGVRTQLGLTANETVECMMTRARQTRIPDLERALEDAVRNLECDGRSETNAYDPSRMALMRREALRLLRAGRTLSDPDPWHFDLQGRGERATNVLGKPGRAFDGKDAYAYAIEGKMAYGLIPLMTSGYRNIKEPVPAIAVECGTDGHPLRCTLRAPLLFFESPQDNAKYLHDVLIVDFDFHAADTPIKMCVERQGRVVHGLKMRSQGITPIFEPLAPQADGCFILPVGDRSLSGLARQRIFEIDDRGKELMAAGDVEMDAPGFRLDFNDRVPNLLRLLAAKLETTP